MKDLSIRRLIHDAFALYERAYVFVNVTLILSLSVLLTFITLLSSQPVTAAILSVIWGAFQLFIYIANLRVGNREKECFQMLVARRAVRFILLLSSSVMFLSLIAIFPLIYLMAYFSFLQDALVLVGLGLIRLLVYSVFLCYSCVGAVASTSLSHYKRAYLNYRLAAGISYKVMKRNRDLSIGVLEYKQLTRFFEHGLEAINRHLWLHRHHPQIRVRPMRESLMFILQFGDFLSRQRVFVGIRSLVNALRCENSPQFLNELGRMFSKKPEEIVVMHPSRKERISAYIRDHEITLSFIVSIVSVIITLITLMR